MVKHNLVLLGEFCTDHFIGLIVGDLYFTKINQ